MDQAKLLQVDGGLDSDDVAALKFLCGGHVSRKRLETVCDGLDLFSRLEEEALIDASDLLFLNELLVTIKRFDLLRILDTTKDEVKRLLRERGDCAGLSAYRKMLYTLSENVTDENLRNIKFLVKLPRGKLEASATFLDVLAEMEKQELLEEDNFDKLERILEKCDKQLASIVQEYKRSQVKRAAGGSNPQQGASVFTSISGKPVSQTSPSPHNSLQRGSTAEMGPSRVCGSSSFGSAVVSDAVVPSDEEEGERYPMNRRPRGHCLIINNYNFDQTKTKPKTFGNRQGTEKDAGDLRRVFSQMHFQVVERKDLPSDDMLAAVREFGQMDHADLDAFVCCVLSHGAKGTVVGTDGEEVSIRDLTQPFTRCPTLVGKPKLFFIQACQGHEQQPSAWVGDGHEEGEGGCYQADAHSIMPHTPPPIAADFLIGMATVEDYKAFRHTYSGSIYIQELCKQLEWGCRRNKDILAILTRVNGEVSKQVFFCDRKQMPEPKYTLTKTLVLTMD